MSEVSPGERLAALQAAFDGTFAAPPRLVDGEREELLAIRLSGDPFALRLRELTGVEPRRRVVPLPGAPTGLLGLAGLRGRLVPVYRLSILLGYPERDEAGRFIALAAGGDGAPVGFALDGIDGYLIARRAELHPAVELRRHAPEVLSSAGVARPVISVPSVLASLGGHEPRGLKG